MHPQGLGLADNAEVAPSGAFLTHPAVTAPSSSPNAPLPVLRSLQPGDMGWVISEHGRLYHAEYGWDSRFEALVADIGARLLRRFDPRCEGAWIAECDGRRVGCAFVVRKSARTAQLRLLLVTPEARGMGLGARRTDTCIAFAQAQGYHRMVLWTNECLHTARALYARRGFVLDRSEPYADFGQQLVGETWSLRLRAPATPKKGLR